jgi:hypothetical protein
MLKVCPYCHGVKLVMKIGMMRGPCDVCKGVGKVEVEKDVVQELKDYAVQKREEFTPEEKEFAEKSEKAVDKWIENGMPSKIVDREPKPHKDVNNHGNKLDKRKKKN